MNQKRFSLKRFQSSIIGVFKRFPVPMIVNIFGTIAGLVLVHYSDSVVWEKGLIVLSLSAPLSVGIVLFFESWKKHRSYEWVAYALLGALMIGYFFSLPSTPSENLSLYVRHLLWMLGSVLIVTFIPFVFQRGEHAVHRFWQYVRHLTFACVLTGIWGGALQAGASLSLLSTGFLFDLDINPDRYSEIWVLVMGIFCTMFFLSRLPKVPAEIESEAVFPREIRLFAQFVLVPFVTLYFFILYAYTAKILLTSSWPDGQLAYIILGFSLVGLVTYLALYPLRKEVAWIKYAGNVLFIAMIPQMGLLLWSLWVRVDQYGITENRYFVLVYGLWLLSMSVYLLVSRAKDIRTIPMSLCFILLLSSFGPWGAVAVSVNSQFQRLENLLVEKAFIVNGKYIAENAEVSGDEEKQVVSILRFLNDHQSMNKLEGWFDGTVDVEDLAGQGSVSRFSNKILRIHRARPVVDPPSTINIVMPPIQQGGEDISGYQYLLSYNNHAPAPIIVGDSTFTFELDEPNQRVNVLLNGEWLGYILISDVLKKYHENDPGDTIQARYIIYIDTDRFRARVVTRGLNALQNEQNLEVRSLTMDIFLGLK